MAKLYYVQDLPFVVDSNPVVLGDAQCRRRVPYDGEILGNRTVPRIAGHIRDAGTGAGTATQIQIRNVTQGRDYFDTRPEFRVDDKDVNGHAVLASNAVLGTRPTFRQNDILALDVDGLPDGENSADFTVELTCGFWQEAD